MQPHPKFFLDDSGNLHLNAGEYGREIEVACFTPDGARLLTVFEVGIARVWDIASGALIGEIHPTSPLENSDAGPTTSPFQVYIEAACLSPDGALALLGLNDGTAGVFEVATGARLSTLHDPGVPPAASWSLIRAVAYAPDAQRVAVGFFGRAVGVWNARGDRLVTFLRDEDRSPGNDDHGPRPSLAVCLSFSADARHLFAGFADGAVTIWDLETQQPIFRATEHIENVLALAVLPSGVRWATDGGAVWEAMSGSTPKRMLATGALWREVAFSLDGLALLARTDDEVQHWNIASRTVTRIPIQGRVSRMRRAQLLAWMPDGRTHVFPAAGDQLTVVDGSTLRTLSHTERIKRGIVSANGRQLVVEGEDGTVAVWSEPSGSTQRTITCERAIADTAISPDGRWLAVASFGLSPGSAIRPIVIWDLITEQQVHRLVGQTGATRSLAFAPDGRWLVAASVDGYIRQWSLVAPDQEDLPPTAELEIADLDTSHLRVLADGRIVLFRRSAIEVWRDLAQRLVRIPVSFSYDTCWAISADERQIAVAASEQHVRLWSLDDGTLLGKHAAPIARPRSLFSLEIMVALKSTAGAAVWDGPGDPYLYIGDGPRGWATPLPQSADRRLVIMPGRNDAGLIVLSEPPQLVQRLPFGGRLRAGCITDQQVLLLNADGVVYRSERDDRS
jgi:WD40 repeat protein